jgi:hypothetical protein
MVEKPISGVGGRMAPSTSADILLLQEIRDTLADVQKTMAEVSGVVQAWYAEFNSRRPG